MVRCKWNKSKRQCDRSDGNFCDITATRFSGRKGYMVTIYGSGLTARGKLKTHKARAVRSLADARSFCLTQVR